MSIFSHADVREGIRFGCEGDSTTLASRKRFACALSPKHDVCQGHDDCILRGCAHDGNLLQADKGRTVQALQSLNLLVRLDQ